MSSTDVGLTALVVDDELPALSDLGYLLGRDERVAEVITASSGTEALQVLDGRDVDVVFSDISMPGLDGMALARVISRFRVRPQIVFVTAHDEHAVDAFALAATDYVMKPVRAERLSEAIRRVVVAQTDARRALGMAAAPGEPAAPAVTDETIPVELGGVTRFITRSQIRYAQAHGDYARLHTETGSHLVRVPLSVLEERWADAGFVRIHRSTLVALPHVSEVRMDHGRCSVVVGRRRAAGEPAAHQAPARHPAAPPDRRPAPERRLSVSTPAAGPPQRVRVTSSRRGAAPMHARPVLARPRRADRARRRLPRRPDAGAAEALGRRRGPHRRRPRGAAGHAEPGARRPAPSRCVGVPFPWLVLGVAVYPAAWFLARWYTRQAERIEQDFADVVEPS